MRNTKPLVGLAAIGLVLSLTLTATAGPLGPVHTTAIAFQVAPVHGRTTLEQGWIGVGGTQFPSGTGTSILNDEDCADISYAEQSLYMFSIWREQPPVGLKTLGARVEVADELSVSDPLIDQVCDALGPATNGAIGTDPSDTDNEQAIGYGTLAVRSDDVWFAIMNFASAKFASTASVVSCRVEQSGSSPQFTNEVNRGASLLEPVIPAESLAGSTLSTECVDHTDDLDSTWSSGTVNQAGGGPERQSTYSCDEVATPGCADLATGLWATCITALIHDPVVMTQGTESDYTWWWVEDSNLGFAAQWGSPLSWDGEDWRDQFTSQQECSTLGSFQV